MSAVMLRNVSDVCGYLGNVCRYRQDEDISDAIETTTRRNEADNTLTRYNNIHKIYTYIMYVRIWLRKAENPEVLRQQKSSKASKTYGEDSSENLSWRYQLD